MKKGSYSIAQGGSFGPRASVPKENFSFGRCPSSRGTDEASYLSFFGEGGKISPFEGKFRGRNAGGWVGWVGGCRVFSLRKGSTVVIEEKSGQKH